MLRPNRRSTQLASYSYESVTNLLKTLAYGNGDVVQYAYDKQGRLIKQTYEDNDTVTYLYDNDGILSTVIDSASGIKTKYYYDFAGRLVKYTEDGSNNSLDHTVAYVYDEKDQISQRKSTSLGSTWTVTTDYDDDGRITSATQSNVSRDFEYDNKNRLTSTTLKRDSTDALVTSYIYKANTAMLSTVKLENAAGNEGKWQYSYDDNGNISQITTTVNNTPKTTQYFYDTAGQLVRENNEKAGITTLWTYDNAGNILTEKVYAYTTADTPTSLQKTNTYTYTSTQWGDLLTSYNGNMIYYDGMTTLGSFKVGNPTTYYNGTHWEFTWEHGRQLATMTSGSTTWTNTYNSDGLRTSRTDGTTTYTYIYENGRLSAIKRNDLNMWIIYDDNGPVTLKYGSGTFHYVTNPQGDVVAIVGGQGQKLVEYTYDAWGKVTSITGDYAYNLGVHNPILYRGYIYDHETGLYYCQSRYYDPQTHRFLNADAFASTGQGLLGNNMFAYCGNNPVNYEDSSGTYHRSLDSSIRSVSYEAPGTKGTALAQLQRETPNAPFVIDISGSMQIPGAPAYAKGGITFLFDYEKGEIYLYPHIGLAFGYSNGWSGSIGVVSNYSNPDNYSGISFDANGAYYMGLDYSWNPTVPYDSATKTNSITFSPGASGGFGFDLYTHAICIFDDGR